MEKFIENPKKFYYGIGIIISSILVANLHVAVWPFIFVLSLPYIAEYIICCLADFIIYRKYKIAFKKILLKIKTKKKKETKEKKKTKKKTEKTEKKQKNKTVIKIVIALSIIIIAVINYNLY